MKAFIIFFALISFCGVFGNPVPDDLILPSPEENTFYGTFQPQSHTIEAPATKTPATDFPVATSKNQMEVFSTSAASTLLPAPTSINQMSTTILERGIQSRQPWNGMPMVPVDCLNCIHGILATVLGMDWTYTVSVFSTQAGTKTFGEALVTCSERGFACNAQLTGIYWTGWSLTVTAGAWVGLITSRYGLLHDEL